MRQVFTIENNVAGFLLVIDHRGHHLRGISIFNATDINFNLQQKLLFQRIKMYFVKVAERLRLKPQQW
jgi:hypothetical protein